MDRKILSKKSAVNRFNSLRQRICFCETMMPNITFRETICLNNMNGNISYYSEFIATNGRKLYTEEI